MIFCEVEFMSFRHAIHIRLYVKRKKGIVKQAVGRHNDLLGARNKSLCDHLSV